MEIVSLTLGPYAVHTYLVQTSSGCYIIDPEENTGEIQAALQAQGWQPVAILITHAHLDHVRGIASLPPSLPVYIHEIEAPYIAGQNETLGLPFVKHMKVPNPIHPLKDMASVGPFTAIHTPGHSPGGVLYVMPNHVFSGDTLFVHGVPNLSFILCDEQAYIASLEKINRLLDQSADLHPGHGVQGKVYMGIPHAQL